MQGDFRYGQLPIVETNDWHGWVKFFLRGITAQARKNSGRVKAIHGLYNEMKVRVQQITHSQYSAALVDAIFSYPISNSGILTQFTGVKAQSILKMIRQLRDAGVLCTVREKSGRAPAIYAFPELVNITEGREVFSKLEDDEEPTRF